MLTERSNVQASQGMEIFTHDNVERSFETTDELEVMIKDLIEEEKQYSDGYESLKSLRDWKLWESMQSLESAKFGN